MEMNMIGASNCIDLGIYFITIKSHKINKHEKKDVMIINNQATTLRALLFISLRNGHLILLYSFLMDCHIM